MILYLLACALSQVSDYVRSSLVLNEHPSHLVSHDLDGDGRNDLVAVFDHEFVIWRQPADGHFAFSAADQTIAISARAACFEFADLEQDGTCELLLLEEGSRVVVYRMGGDHRLVRDQEPLVSGLTAIIMDGLRHLRFVRDVNGDQKLDLVIPAPESFVLYLQGRDAQGKLVMQPGPQVAADVSITITSGTGRSLGESIGESVRVPFFRIHDVNGDGKPDLISETAELVACYLGGKDGLPLTPTFTLDLKALRREITSPDEESSFDPNNIAKGAGESVDHRAADVNQDGIEDHVIRQGQKVSLFLGTASGVDFSKPDQVLKASGNVLTHWVTDADDDGRLDLHLLRMEDISIAEVLLWLVKSGSIDFDLFIYRFEDRSFAKKPTRHLTIDLEIPALLGFMDRVEDLAKDLMTRAQVPTTVGDLQGAGKRRDGLMVKDKKLLVYPGAAPDSWAEEWGAREYWLAFLRRIGYAADKDSYAISLASVDQWIPLPGYELGQVLEQHTPSFTIALQLGDQSLGIDWFYVRDLNHDGKDDLILLGPGTTDDKGGQFVAEVLIHK